MSTEMDGVTINGYTYGRNTWPPVTGGERNALRAVEALQQKVESLEERLDAAEKALKQARQITDDAIAVLRRGRA